MITLHRPSLWACWRILPWRRACADHLRTPPGTLWSQFRFWCRIRSSRSPHRYWTVKDGGRIVGFAGRVNGSEISLITDPKRRGRGIGSRAVTLVLERAPQGCWGEVYPGNDAVRFWYRLVQSRRGEWRSTYTVRQGHRVPCYYFTLPRKAA